MGSQAISDSSVAIKGASEKRRTTKERVTRDIEQLKETLRLRQEFLKILDTLPFKEGDIAYHKDKGNVVVTGIVPGSKYASPYELRPMTPDDKESVYYEAVGVEGSGLVREADLIPVTEMSKKIYGA